MIAVSSFRPLADDQYSRNQIAAWKSWQTAFGAIYYFNHPEPQLASSITRFLPWEPFPRILDMVELCAAQEGWSCIINADIVVPERFRVTESMLKQSGALCASSWRWQFNPAFGTEYVRVADNGLDFFAAQQSLWCAVLPMVPEELRHGCQRWDSWMLGAFNFMGRDRLVGVTKHKVIMHPEHGDRQYGYDIPDVGGIGTPFWRTELTTPK